MTHSAGMYQDLEGDLLFTREQIAKRVQELGEQISKDYEGKPLTCVCILKGSVIFFADLIREISLPIQIDFLQASSYGEKTESSGVVHILKDLDQPIQDRHLLLVEDIVDSGYTLLCLKRALAHRGAASIRIAALLDKPEGRKVKLDADYVGFTVPNAFVVGYGLDYAETYRNLPEVGILSPRIYAK